MFIFYNIQKYILVFSSIVIILSIIMLTHRSPMSMVLNLNLIVIFSTFILFLLKVEFLSYLFIIVYAGGIILLFLFIIMMLNLKEERPNKVFYMTSIESIFVVMVSFKIIYFFYYFFKSLFIFTGKSQYNYDKYLDYLYKDDLYIFKLLYTSYWLYLIVLGYILLLALIGAIVLTMGLTFLIEPNVLVLKKIDFTSYCNTTLNISNNTPISIHSIYFFLFSLILISFFGIAFSRRNIFILLVFSELLFFAISLHFITISVFFMIPMGQIYALFILSIAAAESVIGLGLLLVMYRTTRTLSLTALNNFRD